MRVAAGYRRVQSTLDEPPADGTSPLLPPSEGQSTVEAARRLQQHGPNALPVQEMPLRRQLLRCCVGGPVTLCVWALLMALLMLTQRWRSCLCIGVVLLVVGGAACWQVRRVEAAAARVEEAQRLRPTAVAFRDGRWQQTPPAQLVPGDLVRLHAGSVVPADCTIDAVVELNEAVLTGESLPLAMGPESMPKMGSLVVQGEARGTVQWTGANTFTGRLLRMLQRQSQGPQAAAARAGKSAGLHSTVAWAMVVSATAAAVLGMLLAGFAHGYRRASLSAACEGAVLVALAALPIGLESAVAVVVAAGAWRLAQREGVLPLRLAAISSMAAMDVLYVDKTGTLTTNALELQEECHLFGPSFTREQVLTLAALALRWREPAMDPLDGIILSAADLDACDAYTQLEYTPFSPTTCRSEATVRGPDGAVFKVTKGLTNAVLRLASDRERWRPEVERIMADLGRRGLRCVMVARSTAEGEGSAEGAAASAAGERDGAIDPPREDTREPRWQLTGILTFLDPLRHDAASTLKRLEAFGIAVKVITGDHPLITKEMVRRLGLGNMSVAATRDAFPRHTRLHDDFLPTTTTADDDDPLTSGDDPPLPHDDATLGENYGAVLRSFSAYADARPQHKYLAVEVARQCGHTVGFLGDGVNDAPALRHADVGIALMTEDCTSGLHRGGEAADGCCGGGGHDVGSMENAEEAGEEESERVTLLAAAASTPWADGYAAGAASAAWAHRVADVVALTPSLHKVADAVLRARATMRIMESVLTFRICSSIHMALFTSLNPFVAPITDPDGTGGTAGRPLRLPPLLIACQTASLAALTVVAALDRPPAMHSLRHAHQWNLLATLLAVAPAAALGVASSLLLQWILADSLNDVNGSWCHAVGVLPIPAEFAAAALFLQLALSTTLVFLSCRARPTTFCWLSCPSVPAAAGVVAALALSTLLAAFIPGGDTEPPLDIFDTPAHRRDPFTHARGLAYSPDRAVRLLLLWVWMWSLCVWWLQELLRVATAALMRRANIGHFRETQEGCRPPQPTGPEGSPGRAPLRSGSPYSFSLGAFGAVERHLLE